MNKQIRSNINPVIWPLTILLLFVLTNAVDAKEVILPYQGMQLKANLETAQGKKMSDGVMMIVHGGLAHSGMELIAYLQDQFKQRGYSTLAISLSLGMSGRSGMYDCKTVHRHRHEDAVNEIQAWSQWLGQQGTNRWVLLGHSRGAGQSALFASQVKDANLKAVVLMSPQTKENGGAGYEKRYQKPLKPLLDQAQSLVKSSKGETVLEHANMMFCRDVKVTAASFVSYYGDGEGLDSPALLPAIKYPVMLTVAENDRVVVDLENKVKPYLKGTSVQVEVIAGSDHFYRDLNADDAVDLIVPFLEENAY